jgi:hypothetical protein
MDGHGDLFVKDRNHQLMIPMSLLRKFELPTKNQLQAGFFQPLSHSSKLLLLSLQRRNRHSQNFPRLTTILGALG